jgi:glycosyltransferase involved in cell wall biosynthesis
MTTLTEPPMEDAVGGAGWRAEVELAQEQALPSGRIVVTSSAPFGVGGLGRHLEEIVAALQRRDDQPACICQSSLASQSPFAPGRSYVAGLVTALAPLTRFSPAWRVWRLSLAFDSEAARRLPAADHLIAFNGTSLAQLRGARRKGFDSVALMSANPHLRRVIRQHDRAYRQHPVERPWSTRLLGRNLREYECADRIYVASHYSWESFLEEGFSEERLSLFPLTPHPRFHPVDERTAADTFDIVYVGSLAVHKGVPLLMEAFGRLAHQDMRLVLIGGWKTRAMRRFIEQARRRDRRITVAPGDPLPALRRARLLVHPAYEDGFAYAPAEALACGVPVLVSEDTGMKELIDPGVTGLILPTGDAGALADAMEAAYRGEVLGR